jgi:quercetin 2,3-dioxygenase
MTRKAFLSHALFGLTPLALTAGLVSKIFTSTNKQSTTMKTGTTTTHTLHKANTRGHASHGWLNSHHTFSFANYYSAEREQFGALRVLNDDEVKPGMGFGTHGHRDMEIVSIPLYGDLEHKDSMGNSEVIKTGDVQIMSAGTGIRHSEYNKNSDKDVRFLQIWILPKNLAITPRYEQKTFAPEKRVNELVTVVAPDDANAVWINQDAYFTLGNLKKGIEKTYTVKKKGNGVYAFIIEGDAVIDGEALNRRDGLGIVDTDTITVKPTSDAEVLLIEVPMA